MRNLKENHLLLLTYLREALAAVSEDMVKELTCERISMVDRFGVVSELTMLEKVSLLQDMIAHGVSRIRKIRNNKRLRGRGDTEDRVTTLWGVSSFWCKF